jgi:type VI secretion system protein ImpH
MTVAFMGLFGPHGAMPQHYTSLVIDRSRPRHKDFSLRDFLDLFNHRTISLFYRAWEKYRFACGYERSHTEHGVPRDLFTFSLFSLVGLGTDGLGGRMAVDDEAIVFYGGHYAHWPRPAVSLELLLADYFDLPLEVIQFRGQWLRLSPEQRSCFPSRSSPTGRNRSLGVDVVIGARVWSVQSKFRVRVGPLTYRQFEDFMPTGLGLKRLCQLARLYAGQEFDFDVQAVLLAKEVPWCKLAGTPAGARRLGWNSWVRAKDFRRDVDDAVFVLKSV